MKDVVLRHLKDISFDTGVHIPFACESGSRAWGLESRDSDWDVRYVYVHPLKYYLKFNDKNSQIHGDGSVTENYLIEEYSNPLDLVGWDLKKYFYLLTKSNPSALEWLLSPTYINRGNFKDIVGDVFYYYCKRSLCYHYYGLANRQYRTYWTEDTGPKSFKKYVYAIRPVIAVNYLHKTRAFPPIKFASLLRFSDKYDLVEMEPKVREEIVDILDRKINADESAIVNYPNLDLWLPEKIEECRELAGKTEAQSWKNKGKLRELCQDLFQDGVLNGFK